jgi:hypothetical protein
LSLLSCLPAAQRRVVHDGSFIAQFADVFKIPLATITQITTTTTKNKLKTSVFIFEVTTIQVSYAITQQTQQGFYDALGKIADFRPRKVQSKKAHRKIFT